MAIQSSNFIPTATNAREMSIMEGQVNTNTALQLATGVAIYNAIVLNLRTATLSIASKTAANIQDITNSLNALGYTWSISSTTLTINW